MPILDEEGNLFGRVNAVDFLAVLFLGALVLTGGVAFVSALESDSDPILTQVVVIRADGLSADAANSIETGPVPMTDVVAIESRSVSGDGENYTATMRVRLRITTTDNGVPLFRRDRLYIGKSLTIELEEQSVNGVVIDADPPEEIRATPTPSPTVTLTSGPTSSVPSTRSTVASPQSSPIPGETRVVTLRASVPPDVARRLSEGPVQSADIVTVEGMTAERDGEEVTLILYVELRVHIGLTSDVFFRGLEVSTGQRLMLDLGENTVKAKIVKL